MKKFLSFICLIFVLFTSGCTAFENVFDFDLDFTDYSVLEQSVKDNALSSNIVVTRRCSHKVAEPIATCTSYGSAVVFKETSKYYYFLTNNHTTELIDGYYYRYLSVSDYDGASYTNDVTIVYSSTEYDLAVGKFPKGDNELNMIELADNNAQKNDITITIGNINDVNNSISFGKVESYEKIDNSAEVDFSVLKHSAETNDIFSGGAVLDRNLKLVAISFIDVETSDGDFYCSYAIPVEKVHEFLKDFDISDYF